MKYIKYIYIFILGFLCFYISQVLLRIPLLTEYLYKDVTFSMIQIKYPLIIGIFIALTAGIFEEGFRFLFREFLIKNSNKIMEPVIFGLGYSIMEILVLFFPIISTVGFSTIGSVAVLERIITVIFHIELTIIIWNGFVVNKKYRYLLMAVLLHGFIDSLIPIFMIFNINIYILEFVYLILVVFIGFFVLKFNKLEV